MSITLKQTEALPESYPVLDPVVPDEVWQRLEAYVAYRWTPRAVTWIAEGPGEWVPPLTPATVSTVEIWTGTEFEAITPYASPLGGYWLSGCGPYRFTATVGAGAVLSAAVKQAAQRLSTYMAAKPGTPGATTDRVKAGTVEIEKTRSESWMAAALQNSGAADLLRNYRRA